MSFWDDLFSGGQQQAYQDLHDSISRGTQARQNYLNQANQSLQPYAENGLTGLNQYQHYLDNFGKHMNNGDWMQGYHESPYAKFQTSEALKAANQAAAASGMLGSGAHQENNMNIASQISSHDMQNYFNNLMSQHGLYQSGLANLANMGYGAANQMGNWAYGTGQGIAGDYANQGAALANKDMAHANIFNNLLGLGINGIATYGASL